MASITNLEAVRARLTAAPATAEPTAEPQAAQPEPQAKEAQTPAEHDPLELVLIELTRECAEWLLADINKLRSRLAQSVHDPKTRQPKREKKRIQLSFATVISTAIEYALTHNDDEND